MSERSTDIEFWELEAEQQQQSQRQLAAGGHAPAAAQGGKSPYDEVGANFGGMMLPEAFPT